VSLCDWPGFGLNKITTLLAQSRGFPSPLIFTPWCAVELRGRSVCSLLFKETNPLTKVMPPASHGKKKPLTPPQTHLRARGDLSSTLSVLLVFGVEDPVRPRRFIFWEKGGAVEKERGVD